ncbi:guanine nucleotide-binding protein (G protein), subunit gamma [Oopsacas minuta]|uniref:Guanine nucleotide-binding protein subunit gamma n=1 Tax=Oopsacas minuta TaxID=111878 RepID=A0AAV7KG05_9METZ|nr:guanine nucleotide-binding protein (G protein), subunit gamma [Oopsacas minuta]
MDRVQEEIEQYKKELARERAKVSDSAHEIIQYTTREADPLRDGVTNADNPFKKNESARSVVVSSVNN